jgi:hypothetical protein
MQMDAATSVSDMPGDDIGQAASSGGTLEGGKAQLPMRRQPRLV